MTGKLILAVPSKGRLMEQAASRLAAAGLAIEKAGAERGYRGSIASQPGIAVSFLSASEIVQHLRDGRVHLGITGEDLVREQVHDAENRLRFIAPLGFGRARVVVAVPACWIDVRRMADIEAIAPAFRRAHGRHLRVATKYMNLARRHFAAHGISGYRIVESLGATEGTPAAGTADIIVDITTTGSTLAANHLRILEDGEILSSQAWLFASQAAKWTSAAGRLCDSIAERLAG